VLGALSSSRRATAVAHWLILLIILFVTAIHSIVFGHSRYHLPLVPFLAHLRRCRVGTSQLA
jgi:hypothetical protein